MTSDPTPLLVRTPSSGMADPSTSEFRHQIIDTPVAIEALCDSDGAGQTSTTTNANDLVDTSSSTANSTSETKDVTHHSPPEPRSENHDDDVNVDVDVDTASSIKTQTNKGIENNTSMTALRLQQNPPLEEESISRGARPPSVPPRQNVTSQTSRSVSAVHHDDETKRVTVSSAPNDVQGGESGMGTAVPNDMSGGGSEAYTTTTTSSKPDNPQELSSSSSNYAKKKRNSGQYPMPYLTPPQQQEQQEQSSHPPRGTDDATMTPMMEFQNELDSIWDRVGDATENGASIAGDGATTTSNNKTGRDQAVQKTIQLLSAILQDILQDGMAAYQGWQKTQTQLKAITIDCESKARDLERLRQSNVSHRESIAVCVKQYARCVSLYVKSGFVLSCIISMVYFCCGLGCYSVCKQKRSVFSLVYANTLYSLRTHKNLTAELVACRGILQDGPTSTRPIRSSSQLDPIPAFQSLDNDRTTRSSHANGT
jgi:hypothetical protein